MRAVRRFFFAVTDSVREYGLLMSLSVPLWRKTEMSSGQPAVIAGITSYPGRIRHAWIAIECMLRQTLPPERLILVLSEEEFPEKHIPWRLRNQVKRGLEILWVANNGRSFDKLVPLLKLYPAATIATFDDDKYFPKDLIHLLVAAHRANPNHVIGARGWIINPVEVSPTVQYGVNWARALPGDRGHHLFLPGGNGALYPPGSLEPGVTDLDAAFELCPTADDIWFWGHAQKQGTPMMCLGLPAHRPLQRTSRGSALSKINKERNNIQLQKVMDFLGIRKNVEHQAKSHV
jgi:hypothetical protein